GIEIGTMDVNASGSGAGDYTIPPVANTGNNLRPTPFSGKAIVCVGKAGSAISNQAPITIV
ncbi:MAG TPA: hypothetical protein VEI97_19055, partial [bacterium]|nr:hypothetical protein [bacterium]